MGVFVRFEANESPRGAVPECTIRNADRRPAMTSPTSRPSETADQPRLPRATRPPVQWTFDAEEKTIFASHPAPVVLQTRDDIAAYFDDGVLFWRRHAGGEKVYVVVDYQNLTVNLDEIEFYTSRVKRVVDECAITVVRYNGSMRQRVAGRMTAIRLHAPSHAYASREEALAVVRALKAGTLALQAGSPPRR